MLCEGKSWRNRNFKMSNQRLAYGVIYPRMRGWWKRRVFLEVGEIEKKIASLVFLCFHVGK